MFISRPTNRGVVYVANRSPQGHRKHIWHAVPVNPAAGVTLIEPSVVPKRIKRRAYKALNQQRGFST